jgi:hypothetical protein
VSKKAVLLNGIVVGEVEATGDMETDLQAIQNFLKEKGLHREISTDDAMHGQANSFAEVANGLYKRDLKESPYKGSSLAPFVVNAVFSIEIYLKAIHCVFGNTIRGHNLSAIFKSLNEEGKSIFLLAAEAVRPHYMLEEGVDIIDCLNSLSTAFEDWRYLYENKKLEAEIQSIRYTMHVAFEACCRAREQKAET